MVYPLIHSVSPYISHNILLFSIEFSTSLVKSVCVGSEGVREAKLHGLELKGKTLKGYEAGVKR